MSEAASSYGEDIVERTGHLIRCLTANIDNSSSPTPSISTSSYTVFFSSTQETDYCQEISDAEMLLAEGSSDNPIDVDREDDEYNDGLSDKDIYDAYDQFLVQQPLRFIPSNTVLDETVMNQMSTRIALSSIQFAQFWQSNRKYWQGRRQVNRETFKVQKSMTTSGRFPSRPVVPSPPVVWEQGSPSRSKGKDPVIHSDW
ncbi:hypothetical protein BGX38DRAFT_1278796 [Terfezia claveryi]|nr:hypothetical protein BGX38DRAFT_1278796 [Terfezia claveryi]